MSTAGQGMHGGDGAGASPGIGPTLQLVDKLATEYGQAPFADEIAQAREDYFTRAGKIFEDDAELFDTRLASFLEWYVIERPLQGGSTPVLRALERANDEGADVTLRRSLAALASSHRSLFEVTAVAGDAVHLDDVLAGARFAVTERRSTVGFELGDIVEARLVWDGRRVAFAKTFLFHPRDAHDEALAAVDAALAKGTPREEIMFALCRLHVRWHRQGHVQAARVYRGGS